MCSRGGRARHHAALLTRHFPLPIPTLNHTLGPNQGCHPTDRHTHTHFYRKTHRRSHACHPCLPRLRQPLLVVAAVRKQDCAPSSPAPHANYYFDDTPISSSVSGVGATEMMRQASLVGAPGAATSTGSTLSSRSHLVFAHPSFEPLSCASGFRFPCPSKPRNRQVSASLECHKRHASGHLQS